MGECEHTEVYWYVASNEQGWRCTCGHKPGEPPGYDPKRDRDQLQDKASGILLELIEAGWLCQMNSDQGDDMVRDAMEHCAKVECYDQHTIVAALMDYRGRSHAVYWKKIGEGVLGGDDKRDRCLGGNLATSWTYKGGESVCACAVEGCACAAQRGLFA